MEIFTCPRREEDGTHLDDTPLKYSGSNLDTWHEGNICSYCGSLNPEEFMEKLEIGQFTLTPTDKDYKVYLDKEGDTTHRKFYFQHLSIEQQKRFIELLNEKKLNFAFPGHFYVMPFFIRKEVM